MTTEKQAAANKANAQQSTGAKTEAGKAIVSGNAIKHGILSKRLILAGENPDDYSQLLDGLIEALKPAGTYELVLVEKMAAAIWRQMRLTNAERASIELGRRLEIYQNRRTIENTLGHTIQDADVSKADVQPFTDEDFERLEWCGSVLAEYEALPDEILDGGNPDAMQQAAPLMFEQLKREAEDEGETLPAYLASIEQSLSRWAEALVKWCEKEQGKHERRKLIRSIAELVQAEKSAPIHNETLARYQGALDAELYRAAEALRKQQEWRLKGLTDAA